MADDPRIEAAARIACIYLFPHLVAHMEGAWAAANPGQRERARLAAEDIIAAADRAAWRLGPPPRDRRVYLAASGSWVYTTTWHPTRGWVDGGPTYAAIPYSEEPLCHQPLPAPPEQKDSDDG